MLNDSMKLPRLLRLARLLVLLASAPVEAVEPGDLAPPLQVAGWFHGPAVDLAAGKGTNLFVVEFWSADDDSCARRVSQLASLHQKFSDRGVRVLAVADGPRAKVESLIARAGTKVDYAVAVDDANRTHESWRKGSEPAGGAFAFIVNRAGRIAWVGRPEGELAGALEQVVTNHAGLEGSLEIIDGDQVVRDYFMLAREGEPERVIAFGGRILAAAPGSPSLLSRMNGLAWGILTRKDPFYRDREFALRASQLAFASTANKNWDYADTLALAHFELGQVEEAIATQKRAIELCPSDSAVARLEETLARYEDAAEQ